MKFVNLGRSGLKVSRIALGCMSFSLNARDWRIDESASFSIIRQALESGINLFDTADMYGEGESEMVLGRAIKRYAKRDEVVIATKVYYPVRPDVNGRGLSRKALFAAIDASLTPLQPSIFSSTTPIAPNWQAIMFRMHSPSIRNCPAVSRIDSMRKLLSGREPACAPTPRDCVRRKSNNRSSEQLDR
jgi:Aldo/keto reductase family